MSWPTKKLGEICDFQNGLWKGKKPPFKEVKVLRNTNFRNDGYLDLNNVAEIEVEKNQLADRILQKGDLILERSGGGPTQPVGRVVYFDADGEFSFSNFTTRIRVKKTKGLYAKYLWWYLNQLYISGATETMQKQTTGIRNLNFSEYKNIEIPLPPLSEQKQIVERIEKLFAKIEEAERLRQAAIADSAALLPSVLHKVFDDARWLQKPLGEVTILTRGPFGGSLKKDIFVSNGYKVYEQKNAINNDFAIGRYFVTREKFLEMKRFAVSPGDLIMSCSGTIGRIAIVPREAQEGIINQALLKITPVKNIVLSEYLKCVLESPLLQKRIFGNVLGLAIKNVAGVKVLKGMKIPLPPIAEQKKIVAYLEAVREKARQLQEAQNAQLADLTALRQSILHQAFH